MDDVQLRTLWQQRQYKDRVAPLARPLGRLMKSTLAKRVRQLHKVAEVWDEVVPEDIREHTALEGFSRGTVTVMVDSAPHRYHLQTLLSGGLAKEIQSRVPQAINKIRLVPGQFYAVDLETGGPRYRF